jgi:RNA 2',3'-cyclic 3'-phosphodiesterase
VLRLFFALQPPAGEGFGLLERAQSLAAELGAPLVPAENLHATLSFVGAVAPEKLDALRAAAATVRGACLELAFDAFDHWDKPKVLCATAREDDGARRAGELGRDLSAAAIAAGFAPDVKPFRPHLTLARKVRATGEWPRAIEPEFRMHCDRFVLMESRRGEIGSIYSVVDSWPLDIASDS